MSLTCFSYASAVEYSQYLVGAARSSTFYGAAASDDDAMIVRTLESVSRQMEQRMDRVFGPRIETHSFDIGRGPGRSDRLLWEHRPPYFSWAYGGYDGGGYGAPYSDAWFAQLGMGAITLLLDDWLLTPTTVTAYQETARTSTPAVLTQGQGNDYLLMPYRESPKRVFRLTETTAKRLGWGQQTLTILGEWGWPYTTTSLTTVKTAATILSTDLTLSAANVTSIASLSAGQTIRLESEQVYCWSQTSSGVYNIYRGVNGTTAASHAAGVSLDRIVYDSALTDLCLEIARNRYRERDAGVTQQVGLNGVVYTRPGAEEEALLCRLDKGYVAKAPPMYAF